MLLHDMLIARYGGATGLRDKALLEGAISRADSRIAYGSADPGSTESIVEAVVADLHRHGRSGRERQPGVARRA